LSGSQDQIDSAIDIVTPENITFQYQLAGPFQRLPAFAIDLVIRLAILLMIGMGLSLFIPFSPGLAAATFLLLYFVLDWFYGGFFETIFNGQTPGKRIVGIRVLTIDGQPINGLQAVLRNILRTVDIFPLVPPMIPFFLVGIAVPMLNRRFQRLGDLACGTMVVAELKSWLTGVTQITDERAKALAAYLPANVDVGRSLARALAAYVDRRRFVTPPRRREIATHLGKPLMVKYGLPQDTSPDLLLCALYYRTFIVEFLGELPAADQGKPPVAGRQRRAPAKAASGTAIGPPVNSDRPTIADSPFSPTLNTDPP